MITQIYLEVFYAVLTVVVFYHAMKTYPDQFGKNHNLLRRLVVCALAALTCVIWLPILSIREILEETR